MNLPTNGDGQPPGQLQQLPIEIGPNAAQALQHYVDRNTEVQLESLKNERFEYETEAELERVYRTRSFRLLVGGVAIVIAGSVTLFWLEEINYAALLLSHGLAFWAGWGTRPVATRHGGADEDD